MRRAASGDRGSAVVDFVLVAAFLVVPLFALIFEVGLALHVRDVLTSLASEGARYGANADVSDPGAVQQKVQDEIASTFSTAYAGHASVTPSMGDVVTVTIKAPVPLPFFAAAPLTMTVRGHALEEAR